MTLCWPQIFSEVTLLFVVIIKQRQRHLQHKRVSPHTPKASCLDVDPEVVLWIFLGFVSYLQSTIHNCQVSHPPSVLTLFFFSFLETKNLNESGGFPKKEIFGQVTCKLWTGHLHLQKHWKEQRGLGIKWFLVGATETKTWWRAHPLRADEHLSDARTMQVQVTTLLRGTRERQYALMLHVTVTLTNG